MYIHVDMNADGFINVTEINHYVLYDPCNSGPSRITGERVIADCDKNNDGLISVADYDAPDSCSTRLGLMRIICVQYNKCPH
jgi:hypothetical protein